MTAPGDGAAVAVEGQHISVEHLTKTFAGRTVLDDVGFDIPPGEVIALLGQNGSGKSTLIKLLTGYHHPDGGSRAAVRLGSERLPLPLKSGGPFRVAAVHQDLALLRAATVAENLMVDHLRHSDRAVAPLNWRALHQRAGQMLACIGVHDLPTKALIDQISPTQQAIVAIARAIDGIQDGGLLILDEVTAFLTHDVVDGLFDIIRDITARGISVLFVSHRLEEVWRVCDRAVVLRNGQLIEDVLLADATEEQLISGIVGHRLEWLYPDKSQAADEDLVRVSCTGSTHLRGFELTATAGEIVGVTGLRGTGYNHVVYAMFGEEPGATGTIEVSGSVVQLDALDAKSAHRLGLRLVPSERLKNGAVAAATVRENATLPVLRRLMRFGAISKRREVRWTKDLIDDFKVLPPDPHAIYSSLSGGNQQKVLVGRSLSTDPSVLLLDEPTQGVDVGSRRDIFTRIMEAAESGVAVIYATTEAQDLAELCHRVLVFRDGAVVGELVGEDVSEENISRLAWGTPPTAAGP